MNPSLLPVLSAFAAAIWSVWTWQSEQEKGREIKRDEMSAQYVNSFIIATQEVQRKVYKILEEDELQYYRSSKEAAHGECASAATFELLCLLSTFFGWGLMTLRFGPYTRDSKMIAIMAQIGEVMESRSRFPGDAFRFTVGDRHALGQAVLRRVGETSSGPAFVNITRFKFEEEMLNPQSEFAGLFRSEEVQCTFAAIERAVSGEPLEGHERLAVFQNLLVDLVTYLEAREGFRIAFGERRRATIFQDQSESEPAEQESDVRIVHHTLGRARLAIPGIQGDAAFAAQLVSQLQGLPHVKRVRANIVAGCVVIESIDDLGAEDLKNKVQALVGR